MRPIVNRCSITPTSRSIGPSRKAATPIASSKPRWAPRCATAVCSNTICGRRLPMTNCGWPTSRSSISVAARSSVSRRCCAGRTRPAAKYRRRLHPDRGRNRRHPADRRLGAAGGLPRGGILEDAAQGRRQRLGRAVAYRDIRQGPASNPDRDRSARQAAGDRDHRDGAGARSQPDAGDASPGQGARRRDRDGRFRHRLLVALQPARLPVDTDQDRPFLHQVGAVPTSRRRRSCARCSAWARALGCR